MAKKLWSVALVVLVAGCAKQPDVEKVPVGTEVQVTREDGGVVQGTLKARDEEKVKVDTGRVTRTVRRDEIADVRRSIAAAGRSRSCCRASPDSASTRCRTARACRWRWSRR